MRFAIALLFLAALLLTACRRDDAELEGYGPGELKKWNDPTYKIIGVGTYNYTDYDIHGVYVLPLDKNDIDYAASTSGGKAQPPDADRWSMEGLGANLAWDLRWKSPKRFKIWWHRVVDAKVFDEAGKNYDVYTNREARSGGAWCESEVEIKETFGEHFGPPFPGRIRDEMVLYFYPDGSVEGHLEFGVDSDIAREDISRRHELPRLEDRACVKEISNPYYGKKRPIVMN